MASDPRYGPRLDGVTLTVRPGLTIDTQSLAAFDFNAILTDGCQVGLPFLGGSLGAELWQVDREVSCGVDDEVSWRQAGDLLFLSWQVPDDGSVDPCRLAEAGYTRLLEFARRRQLPCLLRAWNFMPDINLGQGDEERYRRFCLGRARTLEDSGVHVPELCAGTAIGGRDPMLRIFILAGSRPGINIENPRQVSAYRYPRIYGPRSPSFARATALPQPDGSMLLMISGTASVVGHRTVHEGDLVAQLDEIERNLRSLLSESAARLARPQLADFGPGSLLRAYVRHAADWPAVRDHLARAWPEVPVVGLEGDICRADLLVEIEAVCAG
ncbi:MAG: hypothetical protein EA370_15680 [Wenzhouxiangella sp.]|nr:MAG: hypothetical protein EA370_15680 [Wenzhouxiangella sp.]